MIQPISRPSAQLFYIDIDLREMTTDPVLDKAKQHALDRARQHLLNTLRARSVDIQKSVLGDKFAEVQQLRLEMARLGEWLLDAVDDLDAVPSLLERERGHWLQQPEPITDWGICTECLVPFRSLNGHPDFWKTRPDWETLTEPPCGHSAPLGGGQTQLYILRSFL